MDILEVMKQRHRVRAYLDKPIPEDIRKRLTEAVEKQVIVVSLGYGENQGVPHENKKDINKLFGVKRRGAGLVHGFLRTFTIAEI